MTREENESTEEWHARVAQGYQAARAEEDQHWQRLSTGKTAMSGGLPVLDNAYMDVVDRADQAESEMLEAARAVTRERANYKQNGSLARSALVDVTPGRQLKSGTAPG